MRYHWRHFSVLDLTEEKFPHPRIYEATQAFGAEHAAAISGTTLINPENQCKTWLESNGYVNTSGSMWKRKELTTPESVQ